MEALKMLAIKFDRTGFSDELLLKLYKNILLPRMIEEKMLKLLRQGKVSKWFSGIGQEAISVGAASAMDEDELIFTLHRNLGVFTTRNMPLDRLFCQWQGKAHGFSKGRERSFHFGSMEHGIVGMISHLGPQLSLAAGSALGYKLKNEKKISLAFSGEGGTSQGEFHEALNTAAVWDLPVIFLVENNGYGLSTPTYEQFACKNIADKGMGYGMKSLIIDGNNLLEVYNTIHRLSIEMKEESHPVLLECKTFRMRGHEEASGVKYVPKDLMEHWALRDPVTNYELFLLDEGILNEGQIVSIKSEYKSLIEESLILADNEPAVSSTHEKELADVYAAYEPNISPPSSNKSSEIRLVDAISDGLKQAMRHHPNLILMGQDIAEYGGVFKITEGFLEEFGKDRVRNTTLCESAIIGIALGLSLTGYKAMVEMQFADFVTCGFNQIVNNLAKIHYRWGEKADVVIRMPTGGGVGAGPFHSQSNEAWFAHTPGLKVVYPSNPVDAKGLLLAAFEDPNPVLYFEHKALYRSISGMVPEGYYTTPIGKAIIVHKGINATVLTYGIGVQWAVEAVNELKLDVEVVDLRTLLPLDYETISESVKKTNRVIILHEDTLTGGIGGELSAWINEHLFEYLDAPVMRSAGLDTPIPFALELEKMFMPEARFREKIRKLLAY
ncbi:MAG TPA: dehydrogenase E1 component subunit alpha/beta [Saprospiraceae bacterium]|nr:dehydrogenase E1 component subunit alpha/beta [Saprospiraceae bacterium]